VRTLLTSDGRAPDRALAFAAAAGAGDVSWTDDSAERRRQREVRARSADRLFPAGNAVARGSRGGGGQAAQDAREAAARHPEFFQALPLLRGLSPHLRAHLARLIEARRASRGEALCAPPREGAAAVLVLDGEARVDAGESELAQARVRAGQAWGGDELLAGRAPPPGVLRASSLVCKVAVLRAAALEAFCEAHPENAKHLRRQLAAHRAWLCGDGALSAEQIQDVARATRAAARAGDAAAVRAALAGAGEAVVDACDPDALQNTALHVAVPARAPPLRPAVPHAGAAAPCVAPDPATPPPPRPLAPS